MKPQILDGAIVEDNVVLLAGGVASPGSVLKSMGVYGGCPAKQVRELKKEEIESLIIATADAHTAMAGIHAEECGKTQAEVAVDNEIMHDKYVRERSEWKQASPRRELRASSATHSIGASRSPTVQTAGPERAIRERVAPILADRPPHKLPLRTIRLSPLRRRFAGRSSCLSHLVAELLLSLARSPPINPRSHSLRL